MLDRKICKILRNEIGEFDIVSSIEGANNLGIVIDTADGTRFLKIYRERKDTIIRMQREQNFIELSKVNLSESLPKIFLYCEENQFILFEYLGDSEPVNWDLYVSQSKKFLKQLMFIDSTNSVVASESAFTLNDFSSIIKQRLLTMKQLKLSQDGVEFIKLVEREFDLCRSVSLRPLDKVEILSPSDFGIHNAILDIDRYKFFDFEFAGRDSLWKLSCDYIAQPNHSKIKNIETVLSALFSKKQLIENKESLYFIFHLTLLKWCLIILNSHLRNHCDKDEKTVLSAPKGLELAYQYFESITEKRKNFRIFIESKINESSCSI